MSGNMMFQFQLTMFIMLAIGFVCARLGMFTRKGRESQVNVFINVMIPCSVISAFYKSLTPDVLKQGSWMVFAFTVNLTFCWLIGKVLYRRIRPDEQGILKYATIISNAQFMGFPIVLTVFGEEGLMLASMAMIPATIFSWTVALAQFTSMDGKQGIKSVLKHPCFLAVIIGIVLGVLQIPLHSSITDALERMGNCVMPIAMLIIGSILAGVKPKSILDWKLYYFSAIRLIGIPAVLYLLFTVMRLDPLVRNVTVVMSATPAGTITAMLAEEHGANAEFASQLIFVSTLLSIITLPVLYTLLQLPTIL